MVVSGCLRIAKLSSVDFLSAENLNQCISH
jgi:hypothetical protein